LRIAVRVVAAIVACGVAAGALQSRVAASTSVELSCRRVEPASAPPVVWWTAAQDTERAQLARWCQTVGPVVFQPQPGSTTLPTSAFRTDRLAILTWNLHVGSGDVDGVIARLRAGEFTGERVDDFVLLLQEAYRRDEAIPVRIARDFPVPGRIASAQGRGPAIDHFWRDDRLAVLYAPSMRNGIVDLEREDRGNAIVSTMALRDPVLIELPLEHQRRVAVGATIDGVTTSGRPWRVRLMDVHLDTAMALLHGGPFEARRRQADALLAALNATPSSTAPTATVVAGDFNTWGGGRERALDVLARALPDARDAGAEPTWVGPLGIHATLDHVFVAGPANVTVRRLPDRFGSDHYPLVAVLRF
jgi:endonuclease/exonuclease/phosphatase family metal-dependent hydrolase